MCWTCTVCIDFTESLEILQLLLSSKHSAFGAGFKGHGMITESDLYAIGMESPTAWHLMRDLCERLGIQYPPEYHRDTAKRDAMPDPLTER